MHKCKDLSLHPKDALRKSGTAMTPYNCGTGWREWQVRLILGNFLLASTAEMTNFLRRHCPPPPKKKQLNWVTLCKECCFESVPT